MNPTSKATFITYCLQSLGSPVIDINVATEQIDDRVDEALQLFQLFHMSSVDRMILTHTITQTDIDNGYLTIPEPVMSITKVFWDGNGTIIGDFASGLWQYQADVFGKLGFTSSGGSSNTLTDYVISMQNLSNINYVLGNNPTIEYSQHSNRLFIHDDLTLLKIDQVLAYEAFVIIDPVVYTDIWNDVWLKDYATALIGRQWGENLSKFQQVELPGGMILNGDSIYDRYNERVKDLKDDLDNRYSFPADFMIG